MSEKENYREGYQPTKGIAVNNPNPCSGHQPIQSPNNVTPPKSAPVYIPKK